MKSLVVASLLIVLLLLVLILTGCQASAMDPQKEAFQARIERWEMTPAGVYVPRYHYGQ